MTPSTGRGAGLVRRLGAGVASASRSTVISTLVVLYLFASGVTWAMITPMGGVADEPSHIIYAAGTVRGDLGDLAPVGEHRIYSVLAVVEVPKWVGSMTDPPISPDVFKDMCYAGYPGETADCMPRMTQSTELQNIPTTVTRYPPPYYAIVGSPTLVMAGEPAVYIMRIISAGLAAGMVALGLAVASARRRSWLALGAAAAFTPMAAHFAGSVNPSSLEIGAALGLGIGLMGIDRSAQPHPIRTSGLVAVLAFAVAWSRPQTHLTLIAVVGAAGLVNYSELTAWLRHRTVRLVAITATTLSVLSAFMYNTLFTSPGYRVLAASNSHLGLGGANAGDLAEFEGRFVDLGFDLVGNFGWLDHSPPRTVLLGWTLLALTLIVLAVAIGRNRDRIALILIAAGALILAPLFAITNVLDVSVYQARYHLPLAVLILIGAVVIIFRSNPSRYRVAAWKTLRWGAILAPVAMIVSIASSLYRYSIGGQAQLADLPQLVFGTRLWLPPAGALVIGLVGAVVLALTSRYLRRLTPTVPKATGDYSELSAGAGVKPAH